MFSVDHERRKDGEEQFWIPDSDYAYVTKEIERGRSHSLTYASNFSWQTTISIDMKGMRS